MTSYTGPYQGSTPTGRIRFEIVKTYNDDHTEVHFDAKTYIDFGGAITDSYNDWSVSTEVGSASGTNKSFSLGGAGSVLLHSTTGWRAWEYTDFSASVTGLDAVGATVSHSETIWSSVATKINPTYYATSITSSSFTTANVIAVGNGHSLENLAVQYNTSATATGATTVYKGSWSDLTVTGLDRYKTYVFRCRALNSGGYWGPWGYWKSFKTLAEIPTMGTAYTATSITRNSAIISGLSVNDSGGQNPTNVRVQHNSSESTSGATVVTLGSWGNVTITGLAADTVRYYRVAAYNSAGWSDYGPWKSFTTLDDAPDDMAAPTISALADDSFRATWVAPAMNGATFSTYYYQLSKSETFASTVTTGTTTALYKDFTGLTAGTDYYVRVRANATPDNGGYGVVDTRTTGYAPNSGLRPYISVGTTIHPVEIYTFVDGVRKRLLPMYAHDGLLETE